MNHVSGRNNAEEKNLNDILDALLHHKQNIPLIKARDFQETYFPNVMRALADEFKIKWEGERTIPQIICETFERSPGFFAHGGIYADFHYFVNPSKNIRVEQIRPEDKICLLEKKKEFNDAVNADISHATRFSQITKDYDILTDPQTLNPELSEKYGQMGNLRLQAFEQAINLNNSNIDILMRVLEQDGLQSAIGPARRLLEVGGDNLKIYNYENGEKFGALETCKYQNWKYSTKNILKKLRNTQAGDLGQKMGIDRKTLERLEQGEKPSIKQAQAIEDLYEKSTGVELDPKHRIVKTGKATFFIYREFPKGEQFQPTQPQQHTKFMGVIFKNYDECHGHIRGYIDEKRGVAPQLTLEDLKKY